MLVDTSPRSLKQGSPGDEHDHHHGWTEIYHKDWGEGRVVTFSHGWPLSADAWDGQMLSLAQNGFRVIAHAANAADLPADTAVVLGRMAATVGGLPRPGDRCRVVAWPLAGHGRKLGAGSVLLGPDGEVLAAARTVWITVARPAVAPPAGAGS